MAVAAAAASSGRGAAEETARRERVEFRQRCTELCSHYRRLATAAAASAGSGGAAPAQALVSPVLVSASAVRAAAAARLVEAPAGAAVASADLVDGQATEWDVRAAHCSVRQRRHSATLPLAHSRPANVQRLLSETLNHLLLHTDIRRRRASRQGRRRTLLRSSACLPPRRSSPWRRRLSWCASHSFDHPPAHQTV